MWIYDAGLAVIKVPGRWFWRGNTFSKGPVPKTGPMLLALNHASFLDWLFFDILFPRRSVRYLINEPWYRRSAFWKTLFDIKGVIPTDTFNPAETILRVVEALGREEIVAVFPEGRITHDGKMGRGQPGIAWMAALSGIPVFPCALRGNFEAMPRHKRLPRRHPIHLHIGTPMRFADTPTPSPDPSLVHGFAGRVMEALCMLAGQEERLPVVRPRLPVVDLRSDLEKAMANKSHAPRPARSTSS